MSDNNPLVSVCIPAYNHEKYIVSCLQSIIGQTYKNLELIIIDDGSSDNTKQKIQDLMPQLQDRFVRVVFESQPNAGTCITINKLYKIARGRYIYNIASDDMAWPDAIRVLCDFMESHSDYALAVGDNEIIDGDGNRAYWDKNRKNVYNANDAVYKTFGQFLAINNPRVDFKSDSFGKYETLFGGNYIPNGYLIRRSILAKTGPFTTDAPLEDWWFMMQISKYAKMKYIDRILFSYRWHDNNTMTNANKVQSMADKTAQYEWNLLRHADFKTMLPGVKKRYRQEIKRRFIHKYIYHKTRENGKTHIKLFGCINIKN